MRPIRLVLAVALAGIVVSALVTGTLPAAAGIVAALELTEIEVDEALTPGQEYQLPALGVLNTCDQAGSYEVTIDHMDDQTVVARAADWFQFEPQSFDLDPGVSTRVAVSIRLPADAQQGDYFVQIEVHPIAVGGRAVDGGIASATRLHFSVKKADGGVFQRATFHLYVALGLVAAVTLAWLVLRCFPLRLRLERR